MKALSPLAILLSALLLQGCVAAPGSRNGGSRFPASWATAVGTSR